MARVKDSSFELMELGYLLLSSAQLKNVNITATGTTDFLTAAEFRELGINITVGTPTGTSPTLTITFNIYDPLLGSGTPIQTITITATALTAAALVRFSIKNGIASVSIGNTITNLGQVGSLPMLWTVTFTVGGTTPSFPVSATYEMRR